VSYASTVLALNPQGYWRLGETSGSTAFDSSGNGINGTYVTVALGEAGLLIGDPDHAARFDSSNPNANYSFVDLGSPSSLNISGQITIAVIISITGLPVFLGGSNDFCIFSKGNDGQSSGYNLDVRTLNSTVTSLAFSSYDQANSILYEVTLDISGWVLNNPYFVVGRFNGSSISLFINGELVASRASPKCPIHSNARSVIGAEDFG
jgi:hypothetical protein